MGFLRMKTKTQALGGYTDISIVFPTDEFCYNDPSTRVRTAHPLTQKNLIQYKPGMKFQTIYFIQGGGDDDYMLYRYMNLERYATENKVMLVTPNICSTYGADTAYGVNAQTYLSEELPVMIQSLFPSSPKREDNFIVGYAMGGNVALATAIMHPEKYAACIDMSGGIGYTLNTENMVRQLREREQLGDQRNNRLYTSTFGPSDQFAGSKHDIYQIAKKGVEDGVEWPDFTITIGSEEDFIRYRVDADYAAMQELGIPCRFIVNVGAGHDFDNWDKMSRIAFNEILPLKRAPIMPD